MISISGCDTPLPFGHSEAPRTGGGAASYGGQNGGRAKTGGRGAFSGRRRYVPFPDVSLDLIKKVKVGKRECGRTADGVCVLTTLRLVSISCMCSPDCISMRKHWQRCRRRLADDDKREDALSPFFLRSLAVVACWPFHFPVASFNLLMARLLTTALSCCSLHSIVPEHQLPPVRPPCVR